MGSSLHREIDVLYLILHRTRDGTSFKGKTDIVELRRRIRKQVLVLRQGGMVRANVGQKRLKRKILRGFF